MKVVADLYCPVDGKVIANNDYLDAHPEEINNLAEKTYIVTVKMNVNI